MGLVALASEYELGGERGEELLSSVSTALAAAGVELVVGRRIVGSAAAALEVCDQLKDSGITSLLIIDVTWQGDAIKYLFTQELRLPTVFWAVPYPESLSMAAVQHYGSVLKAQGIPYTYVYGLPTDEAVVTKAVQVAKAGHAIHALKNTRVALLGPRNYWRVASGQETVNEEWDLSKHFGTTIVHIEMEEITDVAAEVSDVDAQNVLAELEPRTGQVTASATTMLWMAKVYLAMKALIKKYNLDVVAGECYPRYAGLLNVVATWLGDEGFIVETEGDIAGSLVMHLFNTLAADDDVTGASALGEVGSFDDENDYFVLAHEGSTATAYAEDASKVVVSQWEELTSQVSFAVRPMEKATVCSLVGSAGKYKMLVAAASVLQATDEEWDTAGRRMLAKVRFSEKPSSAMEKMIAEGIDHHWVLKEGDYAAVMQIVCNYLKVETLTF
jgi:L-fucose isomerase-like protein